MIRSTEAQGAAEQALKSLTAENQFLMRITYSLLQPLKARHINPTFEHLKCPFGISPQDSNVVNGYNVCGSVPLYLLRDIRRGGIELREVGSPSWPHSTRLLLSCRPAGDNDNYAICNQSCNFLATPVNPFCFGSASQGVWSSCGLRHRAC